MRFRHWWGAEKKKREAEAELAKSRRLLEETRQKIRPLEESYERNTFSGIIRDALALGWDERQRGAG